MENHSFLQLRGGRWCVSLSILVIGILAAMPAEINQEEELDKPTVVEGRELGREAEGS